MSKTSPIIERLKKRRSLSEEISFDQFIREMNERDQKIKNQEQIIPVVSVDPRLHLSKSEHQKHFKTIVKGFKIKDGILSRTIEVTTRAGAPVRTFTMDFELMTEEERRLEDYFAICHKAVVSINGNVSKYYDVKVCIWNTKSMDLIRVYCIRYTCDYLRLR